MDSDGQYGSDGNWVPNLINWIIGFIIFYVWQLVGFIFAFFGMWQTPLDGMMDVYESYAPAQLGTGYASNMPIGG